MKEKVLFKSTSGVSTEKVIGTLPTGGAANMLFVKGSATDYDGIWQALTSAMITGALTVGSLSPSVIAQDSNNRFVTDSQISAWNAKANATDLNNYLPTAGGIMSGLVRFNTYGVNSIGKGTGDGANSTTYNLEIASWWGIAFKDTCYNTINIVFDTRAGKIQTKKVQITDFNNGVVDAPVVAAADGTLAKKAISAAFVTESSDKRFVTDSQISAWNAKVNTSDLSNYLPLTGGVMTGALSWNTYVVEGNPSYGRNSIGKGTGDGPTTTTYNLEIASWWGIAFKDSCFNTVSIVFDTRIGQIQSKKLKLTDFSNGVVDAPVVAAADGTLAKKAISAAFVTESTDKRFVTDSQISAWNTKISGITLEEESTAKSTGNTAINFSHGAYAIVSVVGKVVRYNVDVVTDNSRWLDNVTNPVATNLVKGKLDGKADWGHGHSWDSISGKPTEFNPTGHSHHWDSIYGKPGAFNVLIKENGADKSVNSALNFSAGAYNIVQVDGNTIRYHCDVVTDNSRWADWCTNPIATNLIKSKLDGKADWGHGHSWDSISGKPTEFNPTGHNHHWNNIDGKPFEFSINSNGSSVVSTNYWFNSKHGCVMEGMSYIHNISSEVIGSNGISTNDLRLNMTPSYAKSSAPSGYLTLDGNRVIFVNSFY